jgi:transposase-like protein
LPDTKSNREAVLIFFRLLNDKEGNKIFHKELANILNSEAKRDSIEKFSKFREKGYDFKNYFDEEYSSDIDKQLIEKFKREENEPKLIEYNKIEKKDGEFRIITPDYYTDYIPDTEINRKLMIIFLRLLNNKKGKKLKFDVLKEIIESENRQAPSKCLEAFYRKERDFKKYLNLDKLEESERLRLILLKILKKNPLLETTYLKKEINKISGYEDVDEYKVNKALEHISCKEMRKIIIDNLEKGDICYKEEFIIEKLLKIIQKFGKKAENKINKELTGCKQASNLININENIIEESIKKDFKSKELFAEQEITKEKLKDTWNSQIGWRIWTFILYLNGVSTFTAGAWIGVNKSTICRWLSDLSEDWLQSIKQKMVNFSGKLSVDEKWIKIGDCFHYLFVAIDCITGYPIHIQLYPSNNTNHCMLFLAEIKNLGYSPKIIITDGWDPYLKAIKAIFPNAEHTLCRFHVIRSIFRRLKKCRLNDFNLAKKVRNIIKKLFKTKYKKTVKNRMEKIKSILVPDNYKKIMSGMEKKYQQVIKSIGSVIYPSTSNSAENFFSQFERFINPKVKKFQSIESAQKHIKLFFIKYIFSIKHNGKACPLEQASCNVENIPFYHLINSPDVIKLKNRMFDIKTN